ncbi:MAG TPA: hypothetical protein PKJ15_07565, partial [Methanomassiliicoccales archaeon]|nr:hypothetical protein [Methanomassiliicoccales archaeon]
MTGDVNIIGNLTIEDNVTVVFQGYYDFNVIGSLAVEGSAEYPVIFDWNDTAMVYWGSLAFQSGSSGSLSYLNISNCNGIYLDNVSVPISNVNIMTVEFGILGEFYGMEQDVVLNFSDIHINNAFAAVAIINENGSLDVTIERFVADRLVYIGGFGTSTGAVDLAVIDCMFNDSVYGLG